MATLSKHMYNPEYFEILCPVLKECLPEFDPRYFIFRVFDNAWPDLEQHERASHIARVLHDFLPADFPSAAKHLVAVCEALARRLSEDHRHQNIFIAHYIAAYGGDYPQESLSAFGDISALVSVELAIRPFITRYPELSMRHISQWSMSKNGHLRRLSGICDNYFSDVTTSKKSENSFSAENVL